jgi:hypothetical protein
MTPHQRLTHLHRAIGYLGATILEARPGSAVHATAEAAMVALGHGRDAEAIAKLRGRRHPGLRNALSELEAMSS